MNREKIYSSSDDSDSSDEVNASSDSEVEEHVINHVQKFTKLTKPDSKIHKSVQQDSQSSESEVDDGSTSESEEDGNHASEYGKSDQDSESEVENNTTCEPEENDQTSKNDTDGSSSDIENESGEGGDRDDQASESDQEDSQSSSSENDPTSEPEENDQTSESDSSSSDSENESGEGGDRDDQASESDPKDSQSSSSENDPTSEPEENDQTSESDNSSSEREIKNEPEEGGKRDNHASESDQEDSQSSSSENDPTSEPEENDQTSESDTDSSSSEIEKEPGEDDKRAVQDSSYELEASEKLDNQAFESKVENVPDSEEGGASDLLHRSDKGSHSDEFNDGYDENLYGDEEDKARLMQMTEKEREQEIYNRLENREVMKKRFEIKKKLLHAKENEQNINIISRSKERRNAIEEKKDKKTEAIKVLKKQREKKKLAEIQLQKFTNNQKKDEDWQPDKVDQPVKKIRASDIYSDDESESEASYHSRSEDDAVSKKPVYISTKNELSKMRILRQDLESWVHAPFFNKTVMGGFVKIGIGMHEGKNVYRIAEVTDVVETAKVYELAKTQTNIGLKLKHGSESRVFRCLFISNEDFKDSEFYKWKEAMIKDNIAFPTQDDADKKFQDIQAASNYQYKEQDIEAIVKEKERFKKTPHNYAMTKTKLLKFKEMAEINGNKEEIQKWKAELDQIEERAKMLDKQRTSSISGITFINVRNRRLNITESEKAISEATQSYENIEGDPFTRRRCAPTLVTKKNKSVNSTAFLELTAQKEMRKKIKLDEEIKSKKGSENHKIHTNLDHQHDHLFQAHDFHIDIDLQLTKNSPKKLAVLPAPPKRSLNLEEYKKRRRLI